MKSGFHFEDKYSKALSLIIVSVCFGSSIGGSFQPMRIMLLLFFILYFPNIVKNKLFLKKDQPAWFGLLLFVSWIVCGSLSLLWSPNPMRGLTAGIMAMTIGFISLPLFIFLFRKAKNPLVTVRRCWLICILLTSILSIFELITYKHLPTSETTRILGGVDIMVPHTSATFGNVNDYGTVIAFIIPYLLWGILEEKGNRSKLIYLSALLLGVLFIVVNGSRMGLLVVVFQTLCFLFLFLRHFKKKYIVGGVILIAIVVIALPMDELLITMRYRISNISNAVHEGRGTMVICGWEMLKKSYGFGIGAGGFQKSVIHQPSFKGIVIDPHNFFVEIFAQYGAFIFLFFCFWLFSIFYFALKNKHLTIGARMVVCVTILTLPFIGIMSSHALGYTYYWIFLSCATVISIYNPERIVM